MRTTLTLDDDVAQLIERIRKRRGASLRDVVNDGLLEGLPRLDAPVRPRKPYRMKGVSLGGCLIPKCGRHSPGARGGRGRRLPLILVDTNLLVYAHVADLPQHSVARDWLVERLNGTVRIGLPWSSLIGFMRS